MASVTESPLLLAGWGLEAVLGVPGMSSSTFTFQQMQQVRSSAMCHGI